MTDQTSQSVLPARQFAPKPQRRRLKLSDILIAVVFIIVILALLATLLKQLSLKHEVTEARATTNSMISDIQKQDATAARKLGTATFQSTYTDKQLANLFKPLSGALKGDQSVIKQTVNNGSANKVVSIYYKFTKPQTYYMVVTVAQPNGKSGWQMINFSGSPTESALLKSK